MEQENNNPQADNLELRKKAEEKLRHENELSLLSDEDKAKLVHELRVHQIELEMQNDELRKAQLELQQSRDEFMHFYDFSPVGFVSINEKCNIISANLTLAKKLGTERSNLINQPFSKFVCSDSQDNYYFFKNRLLEKIPSLSVELKLKNGSGSDFDAQLDCIRIDETESSSLQFRISLSDITVRKQTEELIKLHNLFFQPIMDQSPAIIYFKGYDGRFLKVNREFEKTFMLTQEQVYGKTDHDFMPKELADQYRENDLEVLQTGQPKQFEETTILKDGIHTAISLKFPIIDLNGNRKFLCGISTDITERVEAESTLKKSEKRFKDMAELLPSAIVEMDADLKLTFINHAGFEVFGYSQQDLESGLNGIELLHPDDREEAAHRLVDYHDEKRVSPTEYNILKKDGTVVPVLFKAISIKKGDEISGYMSSITDISRLKQTETELRDSEKKHREILEGLNDAAYRMSLPEGQYEYMSKSAEDVFGYNSEEWLNHRMLIKEIIHPDWEKFLNDKWVDLLNGIVPKTYEYKIIDPEGCEKWILQSNTGIYDGQNNIIAIEGLCRDITKQKEAEDQIKASLKEKETLLHEIHHRVKNNMTVISSLLSLQAGKVDNDQAKAALKDSQNRVQSMSAIHETLYQSDNFSAVDMQTYLSNLAGAVAQNYSTGSRVNLKIEAENILIGAKQASPVGLIVNELVTNTFKYAFPDNQEGEIKISLLKNDDQIELTYKDNGIGIPEGFDLQKADSLGLKLVKMLTENQLDGSIDMESNNGTKFTIKFNSVARWEEARRQIVEDEAIIAINDSHHLTF